MSSCPKQTLQRHRLIVRCALLPARFTAYGAPEPSTTTVLPQDDIWAERTAVRMCRETSGVERRVSNRLCCCLNSSAEVPACDLGATAAAECVGSAVSVREKVFKMRMRCTQTGLGTNECVLVPLTALTGCGVNVAAEMAIVNMMTSPSCSSAFAVVVNCKGPHLYKQFCLSAA